MPTIEEIRNEWKGVRSAVGMLIGYIDGKVAQLQDMSEAYRKGYNDGIEAGSLDVKDRVSCAYQDGYAEGLEDAWDAAKRVFAVMDYDEVCNCFSINLANDNYTFFKEYSASDAIQRLKEHDYAKNRVEHSNAQKFVEVFGFAPGYEILDDGREVYPSLNDEFWNAEYKEPPKEET